MNKDYIPIRHEWPVDEHPIYEVRDCRYNVYGEAFYDGYDFVGIRWNAPLKGALLWIDYQVTHWRKKDEMSS